MRKVENQILNELALSKKTIWELLETSNFPLKDFVKAVKTLYNKGLVRADEEGLYLTEKGKKKVDPKILEFKSELCPKCLGKRVILGRKFKEILREFKKIVKERPRPTLDFFQGYMQEQDAVSYTHLTLPTILLV